MTELSRLRQLLKDACEGMSVEDLRRERKEILKGASADLAKLTMASGLPGYQATRRLGYTFNPTPVEVPSDSPRDH